MFRIWNYVENCNLVEGQSSSEANFAKIKVNPRLLENSKKIGKTFNLTDKIYILKLAMKVWVLPKISQLWAFNKGWMCVFVSESKLANGEFHFGPDIGILAIFLAIFYQLGYAWDKSPYGHSKW